jgi:hypothetical protein
MPIFTGWRTTWDIISPAHLDGVLNGAFILYDSNAGYGEFHVADALGNVPLVKSYDDWRGTWTQIVSGYWLDASQNATLFLLFYAQSQGRGEFYSYDNAGNLTFIQGYSDWRTSWDLILPWTLGVNGSQSVSGLLFYQRDGGYAELYATDSSGNITLLRSYNWRSTWDMIIPGNYGGLGWTDLLFYDRSAAQIQIYAFDPAGNMEFLNTTDNVPPQDLILSGLFGGVETIVPSGPYQSDILTYTRELRSAAVFSTDPRGKLNYLRGFSGWRKSWAAIIPLASLDPAVAYSNLLLYDKTNGVGETILYRTPTPWLLRPIEGYASAPSVQPGDALDFYLYSATPDVTVEIYQEGAAETLVWQNAVTVANNNPTSNLANDCNWPVAFTLDVPADWPSAAYVARASNATSTVDILFVVTPANPGANARIIVMLPVTTYQAYNRWGGQCLYGSTQNGVVNWSYGWSDQTPCNNQDIPCTRSMSVSFRRPYATLYDFYYWAVPLFQWCAMMGIPFDVCTAVDLHVGLDLFVNYALVISVGHDEYWSDAMRQNLAAYLGQGGNAAFFSGNTCWWQVRFTDQCATMVCYKDGNLDPVGPDSPFTTTNWYLVQNNPLGPENTTTGVSYRNGGGIIYPPSPMLPFEATNVTNWVMDGTGLVVGDTFGAGELYDQSVVGYEMDGALFTLGVLGDSSPSPVPIGIDGTPTNAIIVAIADLTPWQQGNYVTMLTFQVSDGSGWVFTAATTNWVRGLSTDGNLTAVDQITLNVINQALG